MLADREGTHHIIPRCLVEVLGRDWKGRNLWVVREPAWIQIGGPLQVGILEAPSLCDEAVPPARELTCVRSGKTVERRVRLRTSGKKCEAGCEVVARANL